MSATLTKNAGPSNIGEGFKVCAYSVLFDSAQAAGGEVIDLTGEFDYVYGIIPAGNDTAADNGYIFSAVLPAVGTAVTSSNVKIQMLWNGGDSGEVMLEFTGDAHTIGDLRIIVFGK